VVLTNTSLIVPFVPLPRSLLMPLTALRIQLKVEPAVRLKNYKHMDLLHIAAGLKNLLKLASVNGLLL
jgi:hypothetical protein